MALGMAGRQLTYGQLIERIDRLASVAPALGLRPGNHAALIAPNCPEIIEIVCGLSSAGITTALVNPRLTAHEIRYICDDSNARVVFASPGPAEIVRDVRPASVERVVTIGAEYEELLGRAQPRPPSGALEEWHAFAMHYTAGTTGQPKGVLLPHRSRALTFFAMASEYGCYGPDDRALAIAPLFHGAGFAFAVAPIFFGGYCEILPAFDPQAVLESLVELDVTNTFFVPTHFHAMFALGEAALARCRPRSLRTIICNAAPLPQATKERVVAHFGPGLLHETYGSTEAGIVSNLRPADQLRKQQCVGLPFPCTEIRLLDANAREPAPGEVGEVYSRSPYLFNGYWQRPEATTEALRDGWLTVGDMGRRDEEGYLYLVDRKKDVIISGGINIYPREIEECLATHPVVLESAVVGIADDYWGEAVKAFVVLRRDARASAEEIIDYCATRLARYKLPKQVQFIAALPRNAAGKVLKRELRDVARDS
jgi:long-chain acyl-CoA synthetase